MAGGDAFAACTLSGDVWTCSGFTPGPVTLAPPPASVTVNLLSGATISGGLDVGVFQIVEVNNSGQVVGGDVDVSVSGPGNSVFNNNGGISGTINIDQTLGSTFTFHQFSGQPVGTLNMTGTGSNSLVVNAGTSITNITMTGETNYVDNSGTTANQNIDMTGTILNYVVNRAGAQVNSNLLIAPENVIENFGRFNSGIVFDDGAGIDNASNTVVNNQGATIAGGIHSEADAEDFVENAGIVNGLVELGDGNDYFINHNPNVPAISTNGVDLGAGDDQFWISGGTINGDIVLGTGDDFGIMTGGTLTNRVLGGAGDDQFTWSDGIINAGIDMGADQDQVTFVSLPAASILGNFLPVDGGTGNDVLTFFATTADAVERFDQWERVDVGSRSQLIFSIPGDTLTLGDVGLPTGTGTLFIDETSSVVAGAGDHTVAPSGAGQLVEVGNAGTIDLTLTPSTDSRFIVLGNYTGLDGAMRLETFLADDSSPSDQLVIAGAGAAGTGATRIFVTNLGGPGAPTIADGIRVVDAQGGATTNPDSFALGAPVGAGVFEYLLFQGGVSGDPTTSSDWFLRSQVETTPPPVPIAPPIPPPVTPPPVPIDPPAPPPVTPPPPPGPGPVDPPAPPPVAPPPPTIPDPPTLPGCGAGQLQRLCVTPPPTPPEIVPDIPLIRPEIPSYVIVPGMAQQMGRAALATFHERRGDQFVVNTPGAIVSSFHERSDGQYLIEDSVDLRQGWGRVFGERTEGAWDSVIGSLNYDLAPSFEGRIIGLQAGLDLWRRETADGSIQRVGLFFTHSEVDGDVSGNVLADVDVDSGQLDIDGESLGVSWTHIAAENWYVDAVAMATWIHGEAGSNRGIDADLSGLGLIASLEAGYPVALGGGWTLEPQVQAIVQNIGLGDTDDRFSDIDYDDLSGFTGRVGARLERDGEIAGTAVQYFVSLDYWYDSEADNDVIFNDRSVTTEFEGSSLEIRAGANSQISDRLSLYGSLGYTEDLENDDGFAFGGNLGLRYRW